MTIKYFLDIIAWDETLALEMLSMKHSRIIIRKSLYQPIYKHEKIVTILHFLYNQLNYYTLDSLLIHYND